jgi:predicted Zn finger-like uncharacterized protein
MALITSCPRCGTNFRVTPLHLQAHGGDVRCGRCSHVFNAFSRLSTLQEPETSNFPEETASEVPQAARRAQPAQEQPVTEPHPAGSGTIQPTMGPYRSIIRPEVPLEAPAPEAQVQETGIAREVRETPKANGEAQASPVVTDTLIQGGAVPQRTAEEQPPVEPVPGAAAGSTKAHPATNGAGSHELKGQAHEAEAQGDAAGATRTSEIPPRERAGEAPAGGAAAKEHVGPRPLDPGQEPSHERAFPHAAYSGTYAFESEQSQAASFAWSLGSLLLLIIFTGQTIYFYSTDLAAVAPATKPYLEQYCELFGCSLSPTQQKQLLDIESSDMHIDPVRPSVITLNATIRNHAAYPQALPLFELTFIDAQNRSLASRIFRPDMYLERDANVNGTLAPGNELNVRLHLDTSDLNPAGYRLSLLYPPS